MKSSFVMSIAAAALIVAAVSGGAPTWAGRSEGPVFSTEEVQGLDSRVYTIGFVKDELAYVAVNGLGEADLDVFVYDEAGELVDLDMEVSNQCFVQWVPEQTGTYRIEVLNNDPDASRFELFVNGSSSTILGPMASEVHLLEFDADRPATVRIQGDGTTDLDLSVYDSEGILVASDMGMTDQATVSWVPESSGVFVVEVVNYGTVWNAYRVEVVGQSEDRRYAMALEAEILGQDGHVFNVELERGRSARVVVAGDGTTDLDVYVFDELGNVVAMDEEYIDRAFVSLVPEFTGTFKVVVVNHGTEPNAYEIRID